MIKVKGKYNLRIVASRTWSSINNRRIDFEVLKLRSFSKIIAKMVFLQTVSERCSLEKIKRA